jgi:hypothetical protein
MIGLGAVLWIVLADGMIDRAGKPLGTDFMSFYAAARLALAGTPALAWDPAAHQLAETAIFGRDLGYWAFFYPPPWLMYVTPLGLLSYGAALVLFAGGTTLAALLLLRRVAGPQLPWLALVACPALWLNLGHGQNAALALLILTGGFALLDRRPVLAGLIFGLLVFKPQLGLALPFALAASGRWKCFISTGLSAVALMLASLGQVGIEGWRAFIVSSSLARQALEADLVGAHKMVSVFAAARLMGSPLYLGYAVQALAAVAALAALWRGAAKGVDGLALGATTVTVTGFVSPFLLDYDLTIMALPLALLFVEGRRTGFPPYGKIILLAAFLLPVVARSLASLTHIGLAPLVTAALLWLTLQTKRAPAMPEP